MSPDASTATELTHAHLTVLEYKGEHATISGIGIIHGLASNDELLLLLTLSLGLASFGAIFVGLAIFTLGVVLGMVIFSTLIKLPFSEIGRERVIKWTNVTIALATLAYGIYSLVGGDTINLLPLNEESLSGGLYMVALILGIKHSMDADHVVAISSILLRAPTLKTTITLSVSWAFGHMLTASIITFILFGFKDLLLDRLLANFEALVGIMLIVIALLTLAWEFDLITWGKHTHGHVHDDGLAHSHD
ncbi:MAG: hypothetical protein ACXAE3_01725 [Candidatus Kariarchaeaceae archaeon]|jgi:hypothetical protein